MLSLPVSEPEHPKVEENHDQLHSSHLDGYTTNHNYDFIQPQGALRPCEHNLHLGVIMWCETGFKAVSTPGLQWPCEWGVRVTFDVIIGKMAGVCI